MDTEYEILWTLTQPDKWLCIMVPLLHPQQTQSFGSVIKADRPIKDDVYLSMDVNLTDVRKFKTLEAAQAHIEQIGIDMLAARRLSGDLISVH